MDVAAAVTELVAVAVSAADAVLVPEGVPVKVPLLSGGHTFRQSWTMSVPTAQFVTSRPSQQVEQPLESVFLQLQPLIPKMSCLLGTTAAPGVKTQAVG